MSDDNKMDKVNNIENKNSTTKELEIFFIPLILESFFTFPSMVQVNDLLKILLFIGTVVLIALFYSYMKHKFVWKRTAIIFMLIVNFSIIIFSIFSAGSIKEYFKHFTNSIQLGQAVDVSEMNENITNISKDLDIINENLFDLLDHYSEYNFIKQNENLEEVIIITEKIKELKEENPDSFSDLDSNKHTVELLYKMKLSSKLFYYCNIIKAFELEGIDCEKFEVNEYRLMSWDIERLFALYKMQESIASDLNKNEFYQEKRLDFDVYKINMSEYSDIFDYGGWGVTYEQNTAEEIYDKLTSRIMEVYKKLKMNFK